MWYATVTEAGEGGRLGTTDYIIPRVFEGMLPYIDVLALLVELVNG